MKPRLHSRVTRFDLAALLVFLAVWVYYVVTVRYGVSYPDEGFFVTVAERFVHGDRPLVDEWQLPQFSCLFFCLPYKLYVSIKGSTDGIILFTRYLFVVINALFYWFMYLRLRTYKWQGLLATAMFCLYIPFGIYSCSYYTIPIRLLMIACLLLFSKKQRTLSMLVAGVLLACSVLYQPSFAFLYFGFSVLVWIRFFRQKKGKPFLDEYASFLSMHAWKYITLSVLICAAVFVTWLLSRSGLQNILTSFPYVLSDPEYDFSSHGKARGAFFYKLSKIGYGYGKIFCFAAFIIVVLSIAYACGAFRKHRKTVRNVLFFLACVLWIVSCVQTIAKVSTVDLFLVAYPIPLLGLGLVCFLLCTHKNKRFLPFWIVGIASSLCVDYYSDVSLAIGCPIAYIAVFIFIADLVQEMQADFAVQRAKSHSGAVKQKKTSVIRIVKLLSVGLFCGCFVVWFAFILLRLDNTPFSIHIITDTPLVTETTACKDGPCRSILYPKVFEKKYNSRLADIDLIKNRNPKNLCIFNLAPELYLYAELPYAVFSPYNFCEPEYLNRLLLYWKLHPEKLPECIYVTYDKSIFSAEDPQGMLSMVHEFLDPLCTYTVETGKAGYILYTSQWHPDAEIITKK